MMNQTEPAKRAGASRGRPNLVMFEARIRAGWSRETLGALAGISAKQVGVIERGEARHSRPETLTAISAALGVDVFVLFPHRKHPIKRRPRATAEAAAA